MTSPYFQPQRTSSIMKSLAELITQPPPKETLNLEPPSWDITDRQVILNRLRVGHSRLTHIYYFYYLQNFSSPQLFSLSLSLEIEKYKHESFFATTSTTYIIIVNVRDYSPHFSPFPPLFRALQYDFKKRSWLRN